MIEYRPLHEKWSEEIIKLADTLVGKDYYTHEIIADQIVRSTWKGQQLSFLAFENKQLIGFRFTSAPTQWTHGRGEALSPHLWPYPQEETAYFQSCFIALDSMGKGIGKGLSQESLRVLRQEKVALVAAHSWKESPHNSSFRYLTKLGFRPLIEYPDYWKEVDYICSLDGSPCRCTAIEMVLELNPTHKTREGSV